MNIKQFLIDYHYICKKHNIQLVADVLDISDLTDDVLTNDNLFALDVDMNFDKNTISYWYNNEYVVLQLPDDETSR
jgi:hypothetical protein